jgi:hypothetical protein
MLKKTITYDDLDGNPVTEDFYFNLTKAELVELEVSEKDGFNKTLQAIVEAEDNQNIIGHFKKLILLSYGVRHEDNVQFIKNDEVRTRFSQMDAYSVLFAELATDDQAAVAFMTGVVPKGMAEEAEKIARKVETTPELPTAPPVLERTNPRTDEELLMMKPDAMSREELQRAFVLKSQPNEAPVATT